LVEKKRDLDWLVECMSDAEDCVVKSLARGGDERGRAASEFSDSESIGHVVFFELESLHQLRRRLREKKKSGNFVLIIVLLSLCDTRKIIKIK
jgi:hypothetical protein